MNKQTEALKLAEDALKRVRTQDMELVQLSMIALAVIKEALAEQPAQQITEAQVEAALKAAHMHSTPESRKDMRRAIEATAPQPAQQEPVAMLFGSLPVYDKPAQQEPVADRENAIIRFALHKFMSNAYSHMNAAALDKDNRHYTVGAVEKFAKDAKDAEALLSRLQFKAPKPAQQQEPISKLFGTLPVYDKLAQRKPLTDEQIDAIADEYLVDYRIPAGCAWNFARDIEAAHGIKGDA